MNRLARRAWATVLLTLFLFGGLVTIVVRYFKDSESWYLHQSNSNIYANGTLNCGLIYDRGGTLLLDSSDGRAYPEDETLRRATLHLLGDVEGNVPAHMLQHYTNELTGYDLFGGSDTSGDTRLELTISAQVQKAALDAMAGRKGTVGVYNYKTGELLCMLSTPSFDPEQPQEVDGTEAYEGAYINRFLHSTFTPGSTFKLLTAAAAIENIADLDMRTFQCSGSWLAGSEMVTCTKEHGEIDFNAALTKSCNVTFAQLAVELGADTLTKYVKKIGLEERLNFDGFRTSAGRFDLDGAQTNAVAWAGVGQHTTQINPCQYMTFMGAIANGGTAAQPYLVKSIAVGEKQTYQAETTQTRQMLTPEGCEKLTASMHQAVVDNYGEYNFAGLYAGAKSGTAERGGDLQPNALFTGFVKDEAYPLAFIVIVEDGGAGSTTCIPIVSQVLNACVASIDATKK